MGKPTDQELEQALNRAKQMREKGEDPEHVAKALLSLNYRYNQWQRVVNATKLYLHSGSAANEHARLVKLIDEVDRLEQAHDVDFGLE